MWKQIISIGLSAIVHVGAIAPVVAERIELGTPEEQEVKPKILEIDLTISHPDDLKVEPGDRVEAGQILSDRSRQRRQLENRLQQLELSLDSLSAISEPPALPKLPQATLAPQKAAIAQAEIETENIHKKIQRQQDQLAAIEVLSLSPQKKSIAIAHQRSKLDELNRQKASSLARLELARSQLAQRQAEIRHRQYEHEKAIAEYQERLAARQQQIAYQRARINQAIAQTEEKLRAISQVVAPFKGKIRRIIWKGGSDGIYSVRLILETQ
jgi:biotin carboxyl carrier protein